MPFPELKARESFLCRFPASSGHQERQQKREVRACREPSLAAPEIPARGQEGSGCPVRDQPSPSSTAWSWGQPNPLVPFQREHPVYPYRSHAGLSVHQENAFPIHSLLFSPLFTFSYSSLQSFCCLTFSLSFIHSPWCPFLTGSTSASGGHASPCQVFDKQDLFRRGN